MIKQSIQHLQNVTAMNDPVFADALCLTRPEFHP